MADVAVPGRRRAERPREGVYGGGVLRSGGRQGRAVGPWGVDGGQGVQGPRLVHQLDVGVRRVAERGAWRFRRATMNWEDVLGRAYRERGPKRVCAFRLTGHELSGLMPGCTLANTIAPDSSGTVFLFRPRTIRVQFRERLRRRRWHGCSDVGPGCTVPQDTR